MKIHEKSKLTQLFYKSVAFLENNNCPSENSIQNLHFMVNLLKAIDFFKAEN